MRLGWSDLQRLSDDGAEEIEIDGFVHPVGWADSHSYFVLGPEEPCCLGCLPRDPRRAIEVFARIPVAPGGRVRLAGRLHRLRGDAAGFRFQMRDARPVGLGRRALLAAGPLMCFAVGAGAASAVETDSARAALEDAATVDMHSHAGRITGVRTVTTGSVAFKAVAEPMRGGNMAAACLAVVSDGPTHRVDADHRIRPFREPDPGELYAFGTRSFERLHMLIAQQGLRVIQTAADLRAARGHAPGVIVSAEGADFLEGRIERVEQARTRWQLRHLQLTHYRVNELGDIQTEAPVHGGLTDFGAEVIRHCNASGIVVDIAHGTFELVKRAADVTTKPLILSHTSLSERPAQRSRLISPEHARLVAETGGVIGIWPPKSRFPTMAALAQGFAAMVDVVGVDHVGLGSDMLGLTGPAIYADYDDTPALAAALLAQGFHADEMRKLLGGNYVRVFGASLG